MSPRYRVLRRNPNDGWWDVDNVDGTREAMYPPGQWQSAVAHAHIAASRDLIRDAKHRELFGAPCPGQMIRAALRSIASRRQSDYALAR